MKSVPMTYPPGALPQKQKFIADSALKCLRTVANHHGKAISLVSLRTQNFYSKGTQTLKGMAQIAESIGFRAHCVRVGFSALGQEVPMPCIIKWNGHGFVVVFRIVQNQIAIGTEKETVTVSKSEFFKNWEPDEDGQGGFLLLEPASNFHQEEGSAEGATPRGLRSLLPYLTRYPRLLRQITLGLMLGTLLKLAMPFLTQSIVDVGIMNHNLNFIYLLLAGQLMLMIGRNSLEAIRGWLLLFVSSRVGLSMLTDFVAKLMRLPIGYFNEKAVGEVMQRVEDQKRVETFLSSQLVAMLFSMVNLIVYTLIFALYDLRIFCIFTGATLLYIGWVSLFMKRRRRYDTQRAKMAEQEQNKLVQIVQGIPDIKLANAELAKRWDWEQVRGRLFQQNIRLLKLSQIQQIGGLVLNETKVLVITFLSAKAVLDGHLSLGAMLAIQQMLGQTNAPTEQLFAYLQQLQDARLSAERINAVHDLPEEESLDYVKTSQVAPEQPLVLRDVSFQYEGALSPVLKDIRLYIPPGKTTAIVGSSGSGKTTLLKLLLKHYEPSSGQISVGKMGLGNISTRTWRSKCAAVLSDGVIFSDTILNNIALGDDDPDMDQVHYAAKMANIHHWIDSTPLGYYTTIGNEQGNISQGQKQRLLIARAVYKNPEFLFFDEGTSALDVQNQQIILQNLEDFFQHRTVIVVAHRLSTIRNADQIVVIENGCIMEKGTHDELLALEGRYYELLTTQLEAAV
jgi:ATP-binding cassette, subfamily B, bacterial